MSIRTPESPSEPGASRTRRRRRPGPFTLLVLPGLTAVVGFAVFMTATGRLTTLLSPDPSTNSAVVADGAVAEHVEDAYVPWLRAAAKTCTVLKPSVLAAQIEQRSSWDTDFATLSGETGIAGFTDAQWRTWGKDEDGNKRSSPRDPVDAIVALAREDCALAKKVTRLKTHGTVTGEPLDLTLAAYTAGTDEVTRAGHVPPKARTYVTAVKALFPRYKTYDRVESGSSGSGAASAVLAPPLTSLVVTSPFGIRQHPLTGVTKLHTGVDFAAPQGAPVSAARQGQVVFAAMTKAYGNRIVIDHGTIGGKRLETTYNHLSALQVTSGQSVDAGTVIGFVGSTGLSTGPHLHFEVLVDGTYTDPMPWLAAGS